MKQADVGVQDIEGDTALHRAVFGGYVEAVLALVYIPPNPVINIRYIYKSKITQLLINYFQK
jgi:ankyrin repeat protein